MSRYKRLRKILALTVSLVMLFSMVSFVKVYADSPKGEWGRVTPIAENNHPNLYYNQSEIDELRNMILVQHSPQNLYDLYMNSIRDVIAIPTMVTTDPEFNPHYTNMKAALSYMIEPTSAKADAIRTSLLSYMDVFPGGIEYNWWNSPGCYFSGYSVPFMYDLLMAYNPEKLSSSEKTDLRNWFYLSSRPGVLDHDPGSGFMQEFGETITEEGKSIGYFANWYSRYMGPSLACALMSGNQDNVDNWADSGWPHDLLTADGITANYPSSSCNVYDLVMYLLAVFPSGANCDTYRREQWKYQGSESDWYTVTYWQEPHNGGMYHWAQMSGVIYGAEMAYHNGMTGVFGITDAGSEPALLRTYKRAIQSRTEIDRRADSLTGHPDIGYNPIIWAGYRRYSDPTIEGALSSLDINLDNDMPGDVLEFFGYPRHVVWSSGSTPTPTPTPSGNDIILQAESYNSMSGITNEGTTIGSCDGGDWVCFNDVNLGSGYSQLVACVAANQYAGQQVIVRLDGASGTAVGTLTVGLTGGWDIYQEQSTSLSGASGTHDIYFCFDGASGVGNFDWFKFSN